MRTGTLTATGFVGPLTGAVNGVAIDTGGVATNFLEATGNYSVPQGEVPAARDLAAGAGLTGGGTLAADRTFDVVANADLSIVVNANDIQVGVLATDAQHGVRGGGTQHSNVVGAGASGFMTGADKTLLDGLVSGSPFLPLAGGTIAGILVITGLKSGTISVPPGGLVSGELWEDTTDDASNPLVRIAA